MLDVVNPRCILFLSRTARGPGEVDGWGVELRWMAGELCRVVRDQDLTSEPDP